MLTLVGLYDFSQFTGTDSTANAAMILIKTSFRAYMNIRNPKRKRRNLHFKLWHLGIRPKSLYAVQRCCVPVLSFFDFRTWRWGMNTQQVDIIFHSILEKFDLYMILFKTSIRWLIDAACMPVFNIRRDKCDHARTHAHVTV